MTDTQARYTHALQWTQGLIVPPSALGLDPTVFARLWAVQGLHETVEAAYACWLRETAR